MFEDQIAYEDKDKCGQHIVEKACIAFFLPAHCLVYHQLLAISVKEQLLLALQ
jgi:hypothetical protein